MAIEFNNFGNYNLNIRVGKETARKTNENQKEQELAEVKQNTSSFKGLENETDLLTQNAQNIYGIHIAKYSASDKSIADETNEILASLGYGNFKVSPEQVASVTNNVNNIVLPALNTADDEAVASRIKDPNGPFADLFA